MPGGGMGMPRRRHGHARQQHGRDARRRRTGEEEEGCPPPGTPEQHAASGADDSLTPPGSEPTLPDEPLKLTQPTFDAIGSDSQPDEEELGRGPSTTRKFYGLYYQENSGKYQFKLCSPCGPSGKCPRAPSQSRPTARRSLAGSTTTAAAPSARTTFSFRWPGTCVTS